MVLSNRGGGKTYDMTCWGIDDFIKNQKQTAWVRRYQTEIDEMLLNGKFFDAVREKYKGHELKIEGNLGYVDGEVAFYFIALSTSRQLKSNNYPNVNKIIFDEFIIEKGRINYLKNEVEVFLDLYETIDRMRDETRAVLMANSITVVNPYFTYFHITPDRTKRFTVCGQVCVELFSDSDFIAAKEKTRFGQLVKGTRYGDYAVNNQWLVDNETFILPKTSSATFMFGMKYGGVMYGFWVDYNAGLMFVNRQYDPSSYCLYCLQREDHDANLLLIKNIRDSKHVQSMVYAFQQGLLRFSDQTVKQQFYEYVGYFTR